MATIINQGSPIRDAETHRQKRNQTQSQKKNVDATKEGVVINSFYKEPKNVNMNELYDSLVISDNAKMPEKLHDDKRTKEKSIVPISLIAVGVMGAVALTSALVRKSAKINLDIATAKRTDHLTRNISITDESVQAIYQMVQTPTQKTILAGTGVLALGAMAFMGKMFTDGFKDVWVKKREADIQKNLQESLIAVETQSFSGKIQIIRGMLAEKAREFSEYLCAKPKNPPVFAQFNSKLKFKGANDDTDKSNNLQYFALGALTLGAIVGLGFLSLKNLGKGKKDLDGFIVGVKDDIKAIVKNSGRRTLDGDKANLKAMFTSIECDEAEIRSLLSPLKWRNKKEKNNLIEDIIFEQKKSTTKADKALGGNGKPKPAFNSFVSDYRAFFYNYLLESDNPQFKMLFYGITGLTAFSYGGKALGEAVKDVQVKKINAQTELELQQKLVATELRNFKAKKDAAIDPLCEEFYVQLQKGKPKDELKTIAENILFEVKNGPPFVYS